MLSLYRTSAFFYRSAQAMHFVDATLPGYDTSNCRLSDSVTTIDTEISTSHVSGSVRQQEGDSTHEIFWATHLTLWNQTGPLLCELRVIVKNLLGAVEILALLSRCPPERVLTVL